MKVLVACEYSGTVRDAMIARGHDAMSCDLLPSDRPGPHHQGSVLDLIGEPFDLVVAHPPCTYMANSGVRWLHEHPDRWKLLEEGAEFFRQMRNFNSPRIAIENPIQHRYAVERHGLGRQTQVIQPWMFGHPEQKATGLWLYGLPKLRPTDDVEWQLELIPNNQRQKVFHMAPSPDRWKERSKTYQGIADAMADQWGVL